MAARLSVLVVDDDPDICAFLEDALEDSGYEVRTAADGRLALALLRDWRPDLILLDLMMPGVNGWAFRHAQLVQQCLASIPVVVMSAGYGAQREAAKLRAAAGLDKPFDLDELLATVTALTA
jgi:DNA-binding response OmpR family regulator